ncbi:MAG: DnaT-like ssDNA-binding protein, partial [Pseudomonadota bacterium]
WPGVPVSGTQDLQWPRSSATDVYGNQIASESVPQAVINATYEAAIYETNNTGSLNRALVTDAVVKRQKVDVIEREFFEPDRGNPAQATRPHIPAITTLLAPYLSGGENPYGITGIVV